MLPPLPVGWKTTTSPITSSGGGLVASPPASHHFPPLPGSDSPRPYTIRAVGGSGVHAWQGQVRVPFRAVVPRASVYQARRAHMQPPTPARPSPTPSATVQGMAPFLYKAAPYRDLVAHRGHYANATSDGLHWHDGRAAAARGQRQE